MSLLFLILFYKISIHTLHKQSDCSWAILVSDIILFQSTLCTSRATRRCYLSIIRHFLISIHTLHKQSDVKTLRAAATQNIFQSTLCTSRATFFGYKKYAPCQFQSTLCTSRATMCCGVWNIVGNFNPHSAQAERPALLRRP